MTKILSNELRSERNESNSNSLKDNQAKSLQLKSK